MHVITHRKTYKIMKKLGTHNSLSYLPCQWWLRPFRWMGRCQRLTISEQYDKGVRRFDIRVKYNDMCVAKSGHGLMTYNVLIKDVLALLDEKKDVTVRLFLENSRFNPEKFFIQFRHDINRWKKEFTNIRFVEGGCRYNYTRFIEDIEPVRICHAEYWKKKFCIPYPLCWARRNNYRLHRGDDDTVCSVYDFVEEGM